MYVDRINDTVDEISAALDNFSEESLTRWQQRYHVNEVAVIDEPPSMA